MLTSEHLNRSLDDRDKTSKHITNLTSHRQQRILEAQLRSLTSQIQKLQQESKKKDATLKKYENFYKEVKARSAQRTAQREVEAAHARAKPQQKQQGEKLGAAGATPSS